MYQKGEDDDFIFEIQMNQQEYAFGAKFNYDMYTNHQDDWKAWDPLTALILISMIYLCSRD